ncbi:MAG TPA: hypothetical protein VFA58_04735 [Chthoniobacterales bacterium]|nr:hypothetical protein [Chthoniobacterales bacterium]
MRSSTSRRAFVAVIASTAFLWALTLSVCPQLHKQIHSDANQGNHSCAVTFVASGNLHHAPVAILINAPFYFDQTRVPELTPLWVQPLFLLASAFEHGPPANS